MPARVCLRARVARDAVLDAPAPSLSPAIPPRVVPPHPHDMRRRHYAEVLHHDLAAIRLRPQCEWFARHSNVALVYQRMSRVEPLRSRQRLGESTAHFATALAGKPDAAWLMQARWTV